MKLRLFLIRQNNFCQGKKRKEPGDSHFLMSLKPGDCARYGQGKYSWKNKSKFLRDKQTYNIPFDPKENDKKSISRGYPTRIDEWEKVMDDFGHFFKIIVMLKGLRCKFKEEPFRTILLSTEDDYLIEHTENDDKWADGLDGKGTNYLGKLLMHVRRELRDNQEYELNGENKMFVKMKDIFPEYYTI